MKKLIKKRLWAFALVLAMALPILVPVVPARAANITKLSPNTTKADKLTGDVSEKYYSLTVDKTGYFNIIFQKADFSADGRDGWRIELCDSNGVAKRDWKTDSSLKTPELNFKKGSKLIIKVSFGGYYKPYDVTYKLRVNTKSNAGWEQEDITKFGPDEKFSSAKQILASKTGRVGSLWNRDYVDYFKYTVDKTGWFKVRLRKTVESADARDGWRLSMYDKSGNEINSWSGIKTSFYTPKMGYKQGTVLYFKVERSGYYSPDDVHYNLIVLFTANSSWEQENNGDSKTSNVIKTSGSRIGSLYYKGDVDCYKFTATKTGKIRITFTKVDATADARDGWRVIMINSGGNEILNQGGLTTTQKLSSVKVTKGKTYYISVTNSGYYSPNDVYYKIAVKYN